VAEPTEEPTELQVAQRRVRWLREQADGRQGMMFVHIAKTLEYMIGWIAAQQDKQDEARKRG